MSRAPFPRRSLAKGARPTLCRRRQHSAGCRVQTQCVGAASFHQVYDLLAMVPARECWRSSFTTHTFTNISMYPNRCLKRCSRRIRWAPISTRKFVTSIRAYVFDDSEALRADARAYRSLLGQRANFVDLSEGLVANKLAGSSVFWAPPSNRKDPIHDLFALIRSPGPSWAHVDCLLWRFRHRTGIRRARGQGGRGRR